MSKGSNRRPTDEKKFSENYDSIFRKPNRLETDLKEEVASRVLSVSFNRESKSRTQREIEDIKQYRAETQAKLLSKLTARTGRPGERDSYPNLDKEYWNLRDKMDNPR